MEIKVLNQRAVLRRHKKALGVPENFRARPIERLRAQTLLAVYGGKDLPDYWFWYRWLLIALHALELYGQN